MPDTNALRLQQKRYWHKTLWFTGVLLALWFAVTFVATFFSEALNQLSFLGLPLGYVIAAQGSLVIYLALIGLYAFLMNRLDRQFGVDEQ